MRILPWVLKMAIRHPKGVGDKNGTGFGRAMSYGRLVGWLAEWGDRA